MLPTVPAKAETSPSMWDCEECNTFAEVHMGDDGNMYCDECWKFYNLRNTRCFSFAALYDKHTGKRIVTDASHIGSGCAERMAMWKLPFEQEESIATPKIAVVARIRRNRNNKKMTFGTSKPCQQCIQAMPFYNIERVCYYTPSEFVWENVASMKNDYTSCSPVIVKL